MGEEHAGAGEGRPSTARTVAGRDELWAQLFSFARVSLGLSTDEVLRCTPRYLAALRKAYIARMEREGWAREVQLAQLIAMVANTGFSRFKETRQPKEFMPSQWKEQPKSRPRRVTKKQKLEVAERLRKRFEAMMK